jgi:hypothetical protein
MRPEGLLTEPKPSPTLFSTRLSRNEHHGNANHTIINRTDIDRTDIDRTDIDRTEIDRATGSGVASRQV